MKYLYSHPAPQNADSAWRKRIVCTVLLVLKMRIPAWMVVFVGARLGKRRSANLIGDVVRLVNRPDAAHRASTVQWILSYGSPIVIRQMIRALAKQEVNDWRLAVVKQGNPSLILLREHRAPAFQWMQTSSHHPRSVLVCLTGNAQRLSMPVQLFHCAAAKAFDLLIYLRDPARQRFTCGAPGLGGNLDELSETLRQSIPADCRIAVLSTSGGGTAALHIGEALSACRAALFSPPYHFKDINAVPDAGVANVGDVRLYFGAYNERDRRLARVWQDAGIAVPIVWLNTRSHGTLLHTASVGGFEELLVWLSRTEDSSSEKELDRSAKKSVSGLHGLCAPRHHISGTR